MTKKSKDIFDAVQIPKRQNYLAYYVVGFTDGEGCFSISLKKQEDTKFGWVVDPVFHITQHKDRRVILEICRRVLGCGRIIPKPGQEESVLQYTVDNRRHLVEKVIPFFQKHKPIAKREEFELFDEVVKALHRGDHKEAERLKEMIKKIYERTGERKHLLEDVLKNIDERVGASETTSRTLGEENSGEDIVQHCLSVA